MRSKKTKDNIYKYKYKYKPKKKYRFPKKILTGFLSIIVLAGLVFLGYTIAAPLLKVISSEETAETETVTTHVSGISVETKSSEVTTEESTDLSANENIDTYGDCISVKLDIEALADADALKSALDEIEDYTYIYGINSVVVPLKSEGGYLNYSSSYKEAVSSGASKSELTLEKIYTLISTEGYTPIAEVNLLEDSVYPLYNANAAYSVQSGSRWIDNALEAGGKPWLDPSKSDSVEYLSSIMQEISETGFKNIICTGVVFPSFRQSDLDYIGDSVKSDSRYEMLANVLNKIKLSVEDNGASVYLYVDVKDYIEGNIEVMKSSNLNISGLVANIDYDEIVSSAFTDSNGDTVDYTDEDKDVILASIFERTEFSSFNNLNVIPQITGNLKDDEVIAVLAETELLGYKSYIINF